MSQNRLEFEALKPHCSLCKWGSFGDFDVRGCNRLDKPDCNEANGHKEFSLAPTERLTYEYQIKGLQGGYLKIV